MANEIKVLFYMTGILATGYGLMKYTVPDEEAMRKKLDPALRKEYDLRKADSQKKNQQILDIMRQASETDEGAIKFADDQLNKK